MDPGVCRAALRATNALLQEADESVRRSCLAKDRARRGYSPMNVENFASLLGQQGPNDLVRKFRVGPLVSREENESKNSLLQPNIWPTTETWDEDSVTSFRSSIETYYESACRAAQTVVQVICDGLQLVHPELESSLEPLRATKGNGGESYSASSDQTTSILTLLGYRTGTRHKGRNKGPLVAAHTDVGVITMLLFDGAKTCASLQRSGGKVGWVDVNLPNTVPQDPIFVVNVADCLSGISRGRLPSTVHRVVARRECTIPRNCCALFVGLDPTTELQIGSEQMTYEEWRKQRIAQSQEVLKASSK